MDNNDQTMHPVDADLLSSDEEFNYPSHSQPSTSFFTTPNLLSNSCRHHNFSLQQFPSPPITQSTIDLALQYLTAPLLIGTEIPIVDSQSTSSTSSEYSAATTTSVAPSQELLNSLLWDQWLCSLATSLTPAQWQLYWMNYFTIFGTIGLPQHLVNFFATAATTNFSSANSLASLQINTNWTLLQQQFYGMYSC